MFSMPMALLRREPKGPDFFLVGLFPGTIRDCRERPQLSAHLPGSPGAPHMPPWALLPQAPKQRQRARMKENVHLQRQFAERETAP